MGLLEGHGQRGAGQEHKQGPTVGLGSRTAVGMARPQNEENVQKLIGLRQVSLNMWPPRAEDTGVSVMSCEDFSAQEVYHRASA